MAAAAACACKHLCVRPDSCSMMMHCHAQAVGSMIWHSKTTPHPTAASPAVLIHIQQCKSSCVRQSETVV